MKLTKTQDTVLNGLLRHILTAAGGALVALFFTGSLSNSGKPKLPTIFRDVHQDCQGK